MEDPKGCIAPLQAERAVPNSLLGHYRSFGILLIETGRAERLGHIEQHGQGKAILHKTLYKAEAQDERHKDDGSMCRECKSCAWKNAISSRLPSH